MKSISYGKMRFLSVLLSLFMIFSVISFPTIKAKAAGTIDDFVERCYTVILNRPSEAEGFADWKNQLVTGQSVGAQVAYGFVFSKEYKNRNRSNKEYVTDLYKLFMDRNPDEGGFNDWVGKLEAGASREEVYVGFVNSQEFYNICDSYGITAGGFYLGYDRNQVNNVNLFVNRLYDTCLGRRGDRKGQQDWVKKLLNKEISGIECARCFVQSKEYVNKNLSNEEYVENLYIAMMGRASDAEGKASWVNALANGTKTRDEVFAGFANSKEFGNICATYKIDKGSYTAKDKAVNNSGNNNSSNSGSQTGPQFRMTKTTRSDGKYFVVKYDKDNNKESSVLYNADGTESRVLYSKKTNASGLDEEYIGYIDAIESSYLHTYNSDHTVRDTIYYAVGSPLARIIEKYDCPDGKIIEKMVANFDSDMNETGYSLTLYEYNSDGNYKKIESYNSDGIQTSTQEYSYDSNKRLISIRFVYYNPESSSENTFTYDSKGNLIEEQRSSNKFVYTYDSNNRKISEKQYNDGVLSYINEYAYDSNGNMKKETCYDADGNLLLTITNEYDSYNNLIKMTSVQSGYEDNPYFETYEYEQY